MKVITRPSGFSKYNRGYYPTLKLKNLTLKGEFFRFIGNELLKKIRLHREVKTKLTVELERFASYQILPPNPKEQEIKNHKILTSMKILKCQRMIDKYEALARKKGYIK